ncbi:MAG: hypothetical protein ACLFR1_12830 [Spirochaetia bacterium]
MKKKQILLVLLVLLMAGSLWAQMSFVSYATANLFTDPEGQFMDTTKYRELESNVFFLDLNMPGSGSTGFQFGLGQSIDTLYIGVVGGLSHRDLVGDDTTTLDSQLILSGTDIIGEIETTTHAKDLSSNTLIDFDVLVGIGMLGIKNAFEYDDDADQGFYAPGFTAPAVVTDASGTLDHTAATASTTQVFDAAGELLEESVTQYGDVVLSDQTIGDALSVGISLDLAGIALAITPEVIFAMYGDSSRSFEESYDRTIGSTTAITYTPSTFLPGEEASELTDLTSYDYAEGETLQDYIKIGGGLGISADMELGSQVLLTPMIDYSIGMDLYSNSYTDSAGENQSVAGTLERYSSTSVQTSLDAGNVARTTTVESYLETVERSFLDHTVSFGAQAEVTPSESFRFALGLVPELTIGTESTTTNMNYSSVTTYDNGDGSDGIGDYVQRTTQTYGGAAEESVSTELDVSVRTGAQFFLIPDVLRINLGSSITYEVLDRETTQSNANGISERTVELADNTTSPEEGDWVTQSYAADTNVSQTIQDDTSFTGYLSNIYYTAGMSFFFSENMNMHFGFGGGDIWNTGNWQFSMMYAY